MKIESHEQIWKSSLHTEAADLATREKEVSRMTCQLSVCSSLDGGAVY